MKRSILGSFAVMLAMAAGTPPSASALGTSASCGLLGDSTQSPAVQVRGGDGAFIVDAWAACQVNGALVTGTFHAEGTFSNTVCGTGTADGSARIPGYTGSNSDGSTTFH